MPSDTCSELDIASDFSHAKDVEDRIVEAAARCGYDEEVMFALRLSLEEALSNAIRHGNAGDVRKRVHISCSVTPSRIEIRVTDEGEGFNPHEVPDPTREENLDKPCGRGIMLMRAFMSEVSYNAKGNEIQLVKLNRRN